MSFALVNSEKEWERCIKELRREINSRTSPNYSNTGMSMDIRAAKALGHLRAVEMYLLGLDINYNNFNNREGF